MTDLEQKFIQLSKTYEELKNSLKETGVELEELMTELGVGTHLQDPNDGTVFEIVKPSGTFISYKSVSYDRTKREGESRGSLSKKRAEELGYQI